MTTTTTRHVTDWTWRRMPLAALQVSIGQVWHLEPVWSDIKELIRGYEYDAPIPPVEIHPGDHKINVPANLVLRGRRRVLALRELGRTHVDLMVAVDPPVDSADSVRRLILERDRDDDNLPLPERILAAEALHRLPKTWRFRSQGPRRTIREKLAADFEMTIRNMNRYLRLLQAPVCVRRLVSAKRIPLILGERTVRLRDDEHADLQKRLAEALDSAEELRKILEEVGAARRFPGWSLRS